MSDWTAGAFKDALKTALEARAGVIGFTAPTVSVFTYWPGEDEWSTDTIVVGYTVADTNEPAALGNNSYTEEVNVESQVLVVRPGAGETVAKTARDRASNMLGEIDNQLRTSPPAVGTQTISARISDRAMDEFPSISGGTAVRVCRIEFTITYKARTAAAS